jgi:hypothetical protein
MMSASLAQQLASKLHLPINTASKQIGRAQNIIKINGFFSSKQSFCYLDSHKHTHNMYKALSEAMYEYGRKYWYCLNAIKLCDGMISKKELECYTNYPIEPLRGHKLFDLIIQKFVDAKIIVYDEDVYSLSPTFKNNPVNILKSRAISQIKMTVLNDFKRIISNIGLVSYNTSEIFEEYGKFRWGIKGVSYAIGLKSEAKPGFIIGDIVFGNSFHLQDVEFFIKKIEHVMSFPKASRVLPFLLIDDIEHEALAELKKKGIIIGFIRELFGEKYANALKELASILQHIETAISNEPKKLIKLIDELEVYNKTLIYNIKGSLFEYFVGYLTSRKYSNISIGKLVYNSNSKHEIDVFAYNEEAVLVIECKAWKKTVGKDEIIKWQREIIPSVKKYIESQEMLQNKRIIFEYWSTSGFSSDALQKLNELKNAKVFDANFYDADTIRDVVKQCKDKALSNTFNNYFLNSNF